MSSENNNHKNKKNVEEQVKELLSGLAGDNGEFLGNSFNPTDPTNWGKLIGVTIFYKCNFCPDTHTVGTTPENFIELFFGEKPIVYFENFHIGLDIAKEREQVTIKFEELLNRCDANDKVLQEGQTLLNKIQKLSDQVQIENSHLRVERDILRRELDRTKAENERLLTGTALDLDYLPATGRRWNFWNPFKGFHLVGRQGQEGK